MIKKLCCLTLTAMLLSVAVFSQNTKTITRDSFSLQYPANWTIDTKDEDYDPDALFSLDAPDDNGMVMFIIVDLPVDLDEMLAEQEKDIRAKLIKSPKSVTNFTKWGNYTGMGKSFKGRIMGVMDGEVNVFVSHIGGRTFYVMEQLFEEGMEDTRSGIKIIASSFKFKGPK